MTRADYFPDEHRLRVEGHAQAGAVGQDIVCAAASILVWTLASAAEEFQMHLFVDDGKGVVEVTCYPEEEQEERCRFLFDTIWNGYEMLGDQYPDNIMTGGYHG